MADDLLADIKQLVQDTYQRQEHRDWVMKCIQKEHGAFLRRHGSGEQGEDLSQHPANHVARILRGELVLPSHHDVHAHIKREKWAELMKQWEGE